MSKEKRSLFSRIFGTDQNSKVPTTATDFHILNGYKSIFTNYDGNDYDYIDVRMCVDTIARNGAKFNPKHIRRKEKGFETLSDNLDRILSKRPNELQNAYKFYYQVYTELMLYNNAFIYISRDKNFKVLGLYPIHYQNLKYYEYNKEIYLKFHFGNGKEKFVALKDCIHLTRFINQDGVSGGNNLPIKKTLSIKHVLDEGLVNAIKTTQSIKGILQSQSMLKETDVRKMRDKFVKDFVDSSDGSGIAGLDATSKFTPVEVKPTTATESQVNSVDKKVLSYFGLCEEIVQSKYTEDQWNAFYESVLEPISLQMSLEFTNKIFTSKEIYHGNEVIFTSNRLQYASNKTKIELIKSGNNVVMVDEFREILNLEPLPDGKGQVLLQDLNHIDSDIANQYQVGEEDNKEETEDEEGGKENE